MPQDEVIKRPGVGAIEANVMEDQARPRAPTAVKAAPVPAAIEVPVVPEVAVVEQPVVDEDEDKGEASDPTGDEGEGDMGADVGTSEGGEDGEG